MTFSTDTDYYNKCTQKQDIQKNCTQEMYTGTKQKNKSTQVYSSYKNCTEVQNSTRNVYVQEIVQKELTQQQNTGTKESGKCNQVHNIRASVYRYILCYSTPSVHSTKKYKKLIVMYTGIELHIE